jgi:AcrR family transcriptional regulator
VKEKEPEMTISKLASNLEPRAIPQQKRAKQKVELILETATKLLADEGIDGFNTNLLAERAGIGIKTIYRYYPNKFAIITALGQRWTDMEYEWLNRMEDLHDVTLDWREAVDRLFDGYAAGLKSQPGAAAIRRAMNAVPELRDIENRNNQGLADELCTALNKRGLNLSGKQEKALTQLLVVASSAVFDFAWMEGRELDQELIVQIKLIWKNHLATYLD